MHSAFIKYFYAPQVRKPSCGVWALITRKRFENNREIIEQTIKALSPDPDENVLEIGFGYGIGLAKILDDGLREGLGQVFGVDHSSAACGHVAKLLKNDVSSGKLTILKEDVLKMSIRNSSFDKAFHVNCFYFWDDIATATKELFRVVKPGGIVVTGMNLTSVRRNVIRGVLEDSKTKPERYSDAMQEAGFTDIKHENCYKELGEGLKHIRIIYATKPGQFVLR